MPSKEPPARKGYHDADIVGYHVKAMLAGDAQAEQVLCSDCWEKTDGDGWRIELGITFADTAEYELVCRICHRQLPTRGEP